MWFALPLALLAAPAAAPSLRTTMLDVHNRERAALRLPPLVWSDDLARDALGYAREMARSRRFAHAVQPAGKPHQGENLWVGTRCAYRIDEMAQAWIDEERRFFVNRITPDFSTTGRWQDVAHYSQIVWAATTRVGCAIAGNRDEEYLVCRYSPAGNVVGQRAY